MWSLLLLTQLVRDALRQSNRHNAKCIDSEFCSFWSKLSFCSCTCVRVEIRLSMCWTFTVYMVYTGGVCLVSTSSLCAVVYCAGHIFENGTCINISGSVPGSVEEVSCTVDLYKDLIRSLICNKVSSSPSTNTWYHIIYIYVARDVADFDDEMLKSFLTRKYVPQHSRTSDISYCW